MTSHNINDVRYGYCGACHDFTSCVPVAEWTDQEAAHVMRIFQPVEEYAILEAYVFRYRASGG